MGEHIIESGDSDRLTKALEVAPGIPVYALDLHGATVGEGSDEHALIFLTLYDAASNPHNFVFHTEAAESLSKALGEAIPMLIKLEEHLKGRRN